jgi:hypothetical protein
LQSTRQGPRLPARRRRTISGPAHVGSRRVPEAPAAEGRDGRRWSDIFSSASVILAGVLVVIGFGFIASRAMRSDHDSPLPQPPPTAALGDNGTSPAPAPGPISLAPSPSPSPSESPSPAPTSKPPTSKPAANPPFEGSISIAAGAVPSEVDLSEEGSKDWVHWGEEGTFSLERDKDGGFAILEGTPSAPRFRHALSPQQFSWTGGDPVDHSDGTTTGIRTCGAGNGFTITAPAGTGTRVLRLYVGVVAARGRLEAKLTAGTATSAVEIEQKSGSFRSVVYTLTYRAPKTAKISLVWTTKDAFGKGCGGVALEAATLR